MPQRHLSPHEKAVWGQVTATVTPISRQAGHRPKDVAVAALAAPRAQTFDNKFNSVSPSRQTPAGSLIIAARQSLAGSLDAGWDRRLAKGMVAPDRTIDLHGETVASAHARLTHVLGDAIATGARVILLVTGKARADNARMPPTSRGIIRASIADWIASSSYAGKIAAVRSAHPRHGGAGALYVILRRPRS